MNEFELINLSSDYSLDQNGDRNCLIRNKEFTHEKFNELLIAFSKYVTIADLENCTVHLRPGRTVDYNLASPASVCPINCTFIGSLGSDKKQDDKDNWEHGLDLLKGW